MFARSTTMTLIIFGILFLVTGCGSSDPAAPAPSIILDTAPPAVPTGLVAKSNEVGVKITWAPNTTDTDFLGFNIYRQAFGGSFPVNEEPILVNSYLDHWPLRKGCIYAVTAIDVNGNESAWAQFSYPGPSADVPIWENEVPGS